MAATSAAVLSQSAVGSQLVAAMMMMLVVGALTLAS
jgi:Tfp pilus assembly protein PilX